MTTPVKPPDVRGAVLIVVFLFGVQFLLAAVAHDLGMPLQGGDPASIVLLAVVSNGIVITTLMRAYRLRYGELFHPSPLSVASVVVVPALPAALVVGGAQIWLADLSYYIAVRLGADTSEVGTLVEMLDGTFLSVIAVCLIAPLVEEMLFRGIILRGFLVHYPPHRAILLSALLFAVIHFNWFQIPVAFALACFAGWLYWRTRSLWPSIVVHALHNTFVYVSFAIGGGSDAYESEGIVLHSPVEGVASLVVSVAGFVALRRLLRPSA